MLDALQPLLGWHAAPNTAYSPPPTEPVIYLPIARASRRTQDTTIHLRTTGDPLTMFSVEETIHQLNRELPLFDVNPLSVTMQLGTLFGRVAATFAGSFGLLAMLLAAVGIDGVVAYSTRQRAREIGIRMALGAEKGGIYRLVLDQGFRLTLAGLVVGTALAVAFTRLLKAQLFGVSETDAITFASVGAASGRCRSGRVPHPRPPRHAS